MYYVYCHNTRTLKQEPRKKVIKLSTTVGAYLATIPCPIISSSAGAYLATVPCHLIGRYCLRRLLRALGTTLPSRKCISIVPSVNRFSVPSLLLRVSKSAARSGCALWTCSSTEDEAEIPLCFTRLNCMVSGQRVQPQTASLLRRTRGVVVVSVAMAVPLPVAMIVIVVVAGSGGGCWVSWLSAAVADVVDGF